MESDHRRLADRVQRKGTAINVLRKFRCYITFTSHGGCAEVFGPFHRESKKVQRTGKQRELSGAGRGTRTPTTLSGLRILSRLRIAITYCITISYLQHLAKCVRNCENFEHFGQFGARRWPPRLLCDLRCLVLERQRGAGDGGPRLAAEPGACVPGSGVEAQWKETASANARAAAHLCDREAECRRAATVDF